MTPRQRLERQIGALKRRLGSIDVVAPPDRGDVVDVVTHQAETELTVTGRERLTDQLARTVEALQRVEDGTYGKCVECGKPIRRARLEAVPEAECCVACQAQIEANGRSGRLRSWDEVLSIEAPAHRLERG